MEKKVACLFGLKFIKWCFYRLVWNSTVGLPGVVVKNLPANAGDVDLISGLNQEDPLE